MATLLVHAPSGPVTLTDRDLLAVGGEAAVYVRDGLACKVYADPARAPSEARLAALAALAVPGAVLPVGPLRDAAGRPIGWVAPYLEDHGPLARLCTRAFREREGVSPADALGLLRRLADQVAAAHAAGAVVVDLHEHNVLVDPAWRRPRLIDVASWQLPGHPATAVADPIRDRHAPPGVFDAGTDWFAFAITAFQVLVGIHPYRGRHPTLTDLDARMRARVTVGHPEVQVPRGAIGSVDALPTRWRRWFAAVLEGPDRIPPPGADDPFPCLPRPAPAAPARVTPSELWRADADLRLAAAGFGRVVAATGDAVWVDGRRAASFAGTRALAFSPAAGLPVAAAVRDGRPWLLDVLGGREWSLDLRVDGLCAADGRLLALGGGRLLELELHELRGPDGTRLLAAPRALGEVPRGATLLDGLAVVQLGAETWVSTSPRPGAHRRLRVPELDGTRPIDGRARGGVAVLVARRGDRIETWQLRLDDRGVEARGPLDDDPPSTELATLSSGVAVWRRGERLELRGAGRGDPRHREVVEPAVAGLRLVGLGDRLGALDGPRLLTLSL